MALGILRHLTPVRSSWETLSAVPPGGNPHRPWRLPLGEDRTASPHRWFLYLGKPQTLDSVALAT
ncbi:MAG: hypothetical protein V7K21_08255 [Nostoc sp.]|uniref:hypothetical protein n=1 Tax=Nostoc sp. TaxID=1180 RepID=UPI002FFA660A